ncbi:YfhO family protein [Rubrobacter indicoceani]|uniref:YfhO family protein n=1 Tax=Rubrobacter indicoceani TaxID=2051957 RepID=UPI000E5B5156|nr:YfhO family protein [Rubrobacter indicoceani]
MISGASEPRRPLPRQKTGRWSGVGKLPDLGAVALILALTVFSSRSILTDGITVGLDSASQFYPWYSFLGETLRSGELPGWNPHQFAGAPLAADPLSGWTYLPAMILFTLLPTVAAAKSYVFLHLLLAGLAAFALARSLGMRAAASLVAAVAYEFSSYLYVRDLCCFAFSSVMVWLPLAILGAELAIRSPGRVHSLLWCAFSGLALSQILASWLGQGSYYALLALGGYVGYRTLLSPPPHLRAVPKRLVSAVAVGGAVLAFGFGLAAAGLLPRLEYNALSGLAGGYTEPGTVGGWSIADWRLLFLPPSDFYAGAGVLALALAAPFLLRGEGRDKGGDDPPETLRRGVPYYGVPYFAALALLALTLSGSGTTLIHTALYQLPLLEQLLPYRAARVLFVFYLAAAMLAGASVSALSEWRRGWAAFAVPMLAALFIATRSTLQLPLDEEARENFLSELPDDPGAWTDRVPYLTDIGVQMVPGAFYALISAAVLAAVCALLPSRLSLVKGGVTVALALVLFVDLNASAGAIVEKRAEVDGTLKLVHLDLGEYYAPTGAAEFLQNAPDPPFRYFGYDPTFDRQGNVIPLNPRHTQPEVKRLEASNRATALGGNLYSIQGYNAVHLARYDEYLRAMNGVPQNYHDADVISAGVYSRLLDLLNVRYAIVPAKITADDPTSLRYLDDEMESAYVGRDLQVVENPDALPRARVVHSARRAEPDEILDLLSSGDVDPRETALLEGPPPKLEARPEQSESRAEITSYKPNYIEVETSTDADGLLVMSEVYYPAWEAYVDGEPVEIRRADYLFRAVEVPAGSHTVEMRYRSRTLTLGIVISCITALVAAVALGVAVRRRGRR